MGLGRGVHWIGNKVSIRRSEKQKYMPEPDWLEAEEARKKRNEEKKQNKEKKRGCRVRTKTQEKSMDRDFKIFNDKGEKTWTGSEDDTASTVAPSLVDEKMEKEFC